MTHKTEMRERYPSGAERWKCITCAREIVLQHYPRLKIIVLEEGNEGIDHYGSEAIEGLNLDLGTDVIEPGTEVPDIFKE